jgi:hypothetical protein
MSDYCKKMIVTTKPEIGLLLNTNASIKVPDGTHLHKYTCLFVAFLAFVVVVVYFIAKEEDGHQLNIFYVVGVGQFKKFV